VAEASLAAGLEPLGAVASPVLGPEGNREFLLHLRVPSHAERFERSGAARPLADAVAQHLDRIARTEAA